jgi:hypothetical protein
MRFRKSNVFAMVALGLGFSWSATAQAGNRHRGEVEIEDLSARITEYDGGWQLRAEYEVETEDYARSRFDLILRLAHNGEVLGDANGQPLDYVVGLDSPSDVDDEELEYEGKINETVFLPSTWDRHDLRLEALLMDRHTNRIVDSRSTKVKAHCTSRCSTCVQLSSHSVSTRYVNTGIVRTTYVAPACVRTRVVRTRHVRPAPVHIRRVIRPAPVRVGYVRHHRVHRAPRRGFHASVTVRR